MRGKTFDIIDGHHRTTVANEKGYPKTLDAVMYRVGKDGHIVKESVSIPVSFLVENNTINPRALSTAQLNKLRRDWNPDMLGAIHVRESNDSVPDRIGASLFRGLNSHIAVTFFDDFIAGITAHDPDVIAIVRILEGFGLTVNKSKGEGHVRSPKTIWNIYGGGKEKKNPDLVRGVLAVVTTAYGATNDALDHLILEGVSKVLRRYGDTIDRNLLARKLSKAPGGPTRLIGKARGLRDLLHGTMANCMAEVIVETYNAGLRTQKLPSWR